jgi:hypothetical protein
VPRPRLQVTAPSLSPGQASYVLDRLVADRRISVGEINRYVSDMHREISALESRLNALRSAAGTGGGSVASAPVRRRPGRPRKVVPVAAFPAAAPARRGRRPGRPSNASLGIVSAAPARRGRRARTAITPQQLASRQLQGRYLGLIRQIPASRRGQFQRIAKEQSREAAIREMESVLKK